MKHNLKRLLSFVLALAMCMSMVWVPAFASGTCPNDAALSGPLQWDTNDGNPKNATVVLCRSQSTEEFSIDFGEYDYEGNARILFDYDRTSLSLESIPGSTNLFAVHTPYAAVGEYTITFRGDKPVKPGEMTLDGPPVMLYPTCTLTVTVREHEWDDDAVPTVDRAATCTSEGMVVAPCKNGCGAILGQLTDKAPHTPGEWVVTKEPTETETGTQVRTCTVCSQTVAEEEIPVKQHTHNYSEADGDIIKDATCKSTGEQEVVHTCSGCGDEYTTTKEIPVDSDKHSFTSYVSDNNATCAADGTKTAVCDNGCGKKNTVTDEGSKTANHTSDPVETAENYTPGASSYTVVTRYPCCGTEVSRREVKVADLGEVSGDQAQKQIGTVSLNDEASTSVTLCVGQTAKYTVNTSGVLYITRTSADASIVKDEFSSTDFWGSITSYTGTLTALAPGKTSFDVNGGRGSRTSPYKKSTIEINVVDHNWQPDHTEEATCITNKIEYQKCANCGAVKKIEYPGTADPNAHKWGEYVYNNDATCVNGTETRTCERCNAAESREAENTANGKHEYGSWYPVEEAKERRDCKNCDAYQERSLHHTKGDFLKEEVITEANCSRTGTKKVTYACADEDCDYVFEETEDIPEDDTKHIGEPTVSYENINLEEGYYNKVTTYSVCHHTVPERVELEERPEVEIDGVMKPAIGSSETVSVKLHAGQQAEVQMETGWLSSFINGLGSLFSWDQLRFTLNYDTSKLEVYYRGQYIGGDNQKVTLRSLSETTFVIVAREDLIRSDNTPINATVTVTAPFNAGKATIEATITPHVETPVIANTHPATCTEPGKITTDKFCRICGYKTTNDAGVVIEGTKPLGHLLGAPKWSWTMYKNDVDWIVTAERFCTREGCDHHESVDVNLDIDTTGNVKKYTATVTDEETETTYTAIKTQELSYQYTYNGTTVDCYYGQPVTLNAGVKSDWFVDGQQVAAGTVVYDFRVSKPTAKITSTPSTVEQAVTALTTIDRIQNADGSYTAKFITDWYVPAGQKVQSVKTYYRLTNTTQTQKTLEDKNQSVTSKLTGNIGTFVANVPVKAQYGRTYKVYAVSCVTLDDGSKVWSEVVFNKPAQ